MDMRIEPEEFDLIVVGTGLQESLIAGAAAKAGKSVLHVDSAAEYGSHWAGHTLDGFLKWAEREHERATGEGASRGGEEPPPQEEELGGELVRCGVDAPVLYKNIELLVGDMSVAAKGREYMLDLAPKATLCNGALVDALVRSGAHNYLECKLLQGHSLYQNGALCAVPASRADVFKDRRLSPGDKRKLMRFLKAVLESLEDGAQDSVDAPPVEDKFDGRPLARLLEEEALPQELRELLLYGLVMAASDQSAEPQPDPLVSAADGKAAMGRYITSVGRYGPNTGAFLMPLYGAGEVPQAFCRVAAVSGAVYVLRCPVEGAVLAAASAEAPRSGRVVTAVRTAAGQTLRCSALAGNPETLSGLVPLSDLEPRGWLSRCIAVTDAPLQDGESQALVVIPPRALGDKAPKQPVYALQMGSSAAVAPPGRYLLYFWTAATGEAGTASDDLKPAVDALLRMPSESDPQAAAAPEAEATGDGQQAGGEAVRPDARPTALVLGYYKQVAGLALRSPASLPENVAMCSLPDGDVDYQKAVDEADALFGRLFPGEKLFAPKPTVPIPSEDGSEQPDGAVPVVAAADDSDDEAIEALGAALKAAGIRGIDDEEIVGNQDSQ